MTPASTFSSCSSTRTSRNTLQPPCCSCQDLPAPRNAAPTPDHRGQRLCNPVPPPARRRRNFFSSTPSKQARLLGRDGLMGSSRAGFWRSSMLALLVGLLSLCQGVQAGENDVFGVEEILPAELLFDRSEPPPLPQWGLLERQDDSATYSFQPSTTIRPTSTVSSGSATMSGTPTIATQTAMAKLPTVFDSSLGNNFTSSTCPTFIQNFLHNQTFKDCLPLSLLLQTSNSFFEASRSLLRITQTLDATCNVNFNQCSALMASLAQQISLSTTCGQDLQILNPIVTQARNGFLAYPTLYHAGCLTDSDGQYCYANAVTNTSAATSSYVYYLPLGTQLPGGARPACDDCLQNTMALFAEQAGNSTLPLSKTYTSAAQQVQMNCGPQFVQASAQQTSAATSHLRLPSFTRPIYFTLLASIMAYMI